jgi:peptidoglycan/xylan/chitin deacetylase (PgdA/CDA1 family)
MTWKFGAALGPAVATLPSRPDLTVLSLPLFWNDARHAGDLAKTGHRGVRRRSLGRRLQSNDAGAATETAHRPAEIARKGIILLHDPKAQTAAMLPAFLRYLRDNHYRVVHVVPADAKTVSGKAH